jgi:tRNA (mo5U34)-methyltransferase
MPNAIADGLEEKILSKKWFYPFILPSGKTTEMYIPDYLAKIHDTRLSMMWGALEPIFHNSWPNVTCLDIASHEGYFAAHLASKGCRQVMGIDAREDHVAQARLIRDVYGYQNLDFRLGDVREPIPQDLEPADIVLVFGLLYHLENPIGAIRLARALTKKVCLIETQVTPNLSGVVEWGHCTYHKQIRGAFTVIDEVDEVERPEASVSGISLVPSVESLVWILRRFNFAQVRLVPVPVDGYEQLVTGNRVMLAAYAA